MKLKTIILLNIIYLCSCNQAEPLGEYPRKFIFDHASIINEAGFVIGDNESYLEIDSRGGNLKIFMDSLEMNPNEFIKDSGWGYYIESFEFLQQDSIKIHFWQNERMDSKTYPMDISGINGEIMDPEILDYSLYWEKNTQELRYCMSWLLVIQQLNGNFIPSISYMPCKDKVLIKTLEEALMEDSYFRGDTVGLYFIDMIYK